MAREEFRRKAPLSFQNPKRVGKRRAYLFGWEQGQARGSKYILCLIGGIIFGVGRCVDLHYITSLNNLAGCTIVAVSSEAETPTGARRSKSQATPQSQRICHAVHTKYICRRTEFISGVSEGAGAVRAFCFRRASSI